MKSSLNYPIALILIILFAGYLLYTGYFEKPQVDIPAYQKLCSRYLQAPAGTYTHDHMQLLVYKINYLFPGPVEKLTAAERQLKHCAEQLADKLKDTK
ncbi:MAG: hypothetical protein P8047_17950 [Gammaproteobacteria bacterium]